MGFTTNIGKVNYHIHTDAIKENLIPKEITKQQASFIYASEADLLNVALFGQTAKDWRENHLDEKGNIRDYASLEQLIVLSNMESINCTFDSSRIESTRTTNSAEQSSHHPNKIVN